MAWLKEINWQELIMNRFVILVATTIGLLALGGCAFNQGIVLSNPPSQASTAWLKGRAFSVGKITVAKGAQPIDNTTYHCLPDPMYAAMMIYNLKLAFKRADLTKGKGPIVPVDFKITQREFKSNLFQGLKPSNLIGTLQFANVSVVMRMNGTRGIGWFNLGPYWTRQQRILPAMAAAITVGIQSIQKGGGFYKPLDFSTSPIVGGYFGYTTLTRHMVNLPYPMTVKEYEHITGQSATQLAAICKAHINGN